MQRSLALSTLLFVSSLACVKTDSADISTSGMFADLSVTADGTGASHAKGALKVGGGASNTFIDLTGDDQLLSSTGDVMHVMSRHELAGAVWYEADFDTDKPETEFTVAFKRTKDAGAPDSKAVLPAAFTISAPAANANASRASDAITVTYAPAGTNDTMAWAASGECILPAFGAIAGDPGTFVIEKGKLLGDPKAAVTCTVTLELVRSRPGTLSTGYGKGGVIAGKQVRRIAMRSAP